ncbi:MAG TPA: beta-ketoacyl-ACP synthase II [Pseudomonadota bacterium]|nr:beta-ketoacyl-ACP synthase II [Pseudomonadota bacterium]HNF96316.1 beta-ketoacyl-ACP synthase II [Pseudomonadota bacterium]HNK43265.1 beta-ketoacyl-ACP synthase II [Pseudomonadota bacterium]HNN50036.1 beta-ketoacyl-ACP synthase II [Pseudomonadota bacterium]
MQRRVVVTGIGLCTPLGLGREASWKACIAGQSGIGPITHFDHSLFTTHFGGEVKGLDPTTFIDKREAKHLDLFVIFALYAAEEAMAHAQLKVSPEPADKPGLFVPGAQLPFGARSDGSYPCDRVGVFIGAGLGGVSHIESTHSTLTERGPGRISPYFVPQIIINMAPGLLSIRKGLKGPNMSQVSACATGAHAIGEAARTISEGAADVMIAGGTEATVSPLGVGGFNAMRALSTRNDAPEKASRPFDVDRDGFVIAEGAGLLVLEERESALRRGVPILAELVGYGRSADGYHMTSPCVDGEGAQRCMRMALRQAHQHGISPTDIGYINAHGTSTRQGDIAETVAIKAVFGDHARKLAVSSTKSMTGHLLGAAGGVEAAFSILALQDGILPPTINLDKPDPECDLDYIPHTARAAQSRAALSNSFGFGGTNASLIFAKHI